MLDKNVIIAILLTVIVIILGVNLYFNWECTKDSSNNEKIWGISSKTFKNTLNIFSIIITIIAWLCCLVLFTTKKTVASTDMLTNTSAPAPAPVPEAPVTYLPQDQFNQNQTPYS